MPSDISIRRFNGLVTHSPNDEGQITDLIRSENTEMYQDGMIRARHGQHFFSNAAAGETQLSFVGVSNFGLSARVLVSAETWYVWDGSKMTPTLTDISTRAFTGGSRTANVVTLTGLPVGHGIGVGTVILVDAADNTYDGTFIVSTSLATSITYAQTAANDASSGAGTIKIAPPGDYRTMGVEWDTKVYFGNGVNLAGIGFLPTPVTFAMTPGFPTAGGDRVAMCIHAERMWVLSMQSGPPRLYFSAPGNPESWPAANFIDIGNHDWDLGTALWSFQNRLYIWTAAEMWVLETPGVPTTWVLRKFADIGANAGAVTEYDGVLFWFGPVGAYSFTGSNIEKVSDPIEDLFRYRAFAGIDAADGFSIVYTTVFRDHWVILMPGGVDDFITRVLVYQVKTKVWSEWNFGFATPGTVDAMTVWAEQDNSFPILAGLYFTWQSPVHGLLTGTELSADYYADESGTRTGTPTVTEYPYSVVIQTKYSDFSDPYNKKRVLDWMIEHDGRDVVFDQIDELDRSVSSSHLAPANTRTVTVSDGQRDFDIVSLTVPSGHGIKVGETVTVDLADNTYDGTFTVLEVDTTEIRYRQDAANDASSGAGTITVTPIRVYEVKARGIGYFRRLSLRLTASNFRAVGFKIHGLYARMRIRGREANQQDQVLS